MSIILAFVNAGGVKRIDPMFYTDHGISVVGISGYIMYFFVVGIILIMSLAGGKFYFCHSFCWMAPFMVVGSKIKNSLKYPSLRLEAESARCAGCMQCSRKCPMSLEVNEMVKRNNMNNPECVLCGQCVDTCTKGAIKYQFKK
jgi:NAD-dependent dihydropyrimidine dehydrogenase PreA subunit